MKNKESRNHKRKEARNCTPKKNLKLLTQFIKSTLHTQKEWTSKL
jgi:hypothetical protein